MLCILVRWNVSEAQMLIKAKRKENTVSDRDTMTNFRQKEDTLNTSTHQLNKKPPEDPLQSSHLFILSIKWATNIYPEAGLLLAIFALWGRHRALQRSSEAVVV